MKPCWQQHSNQWSYSSGESWLIKAFNYNDFTVSNRWLLERMLFLSLYNNLHGEETSPAYVFSKFGRNNLNSYNSKAHVIRTNFESPWGFELYELNCMSTVWKHAQNSFTRLSKGNNRQSRIRTTAIRCAVSLSEHSYSWETTKDPRQSNHIQKMFQSRG